MESIYTKLALYGRENDCARTDAVFLPISEVCNGTVSLAEVAILAIFFVLVAVSTTNVRSKVCMAPFLVQSKDCKFVPHLEGSNADFASHMERRHSFWDQQIAKRAISANLSFFLFQTIYVLVIYMICVTTFDNIDIVSQS